METKDYTQEIIDIIRSNTSPAVMSSRLEDYHANDLAEVLKKLTVQERCKLYRILDKDMLSDILEYTEADEAAEYLKEMEPRKAAAILSIEKDSDPAISVVKALKVRDGSPLDVPIMQFSWDKEKAMHVYLGEKPKEEKDKRKEDELVAVAKEVFSRRRFVTYVELAEEIQSILEVKERTAKSYIRFMREKEIILKSSDNQSYYVIGNF